MRHLTFRFLAVFLSLLLFSLVDMPVSAQCCAGGSGSPIAGGTSQGVLPAGTLELNTNVQWINSTRFKTGDRKDTLRYFDSFESVYQYFRLAYGLSSDFTISVESGNYFLKKETGLHKDPATTYQTKGIGDLVIFPRYRVMQRCSGKRTSEITLGLGYKIPLGSHNDSTREVEPFSNTVYYVTNPQAIQLSSGAQDIIFYGFFFQGLNLKTRLFANLLYVKKGWNPSGEKMGNFASMGIFASRDISPKLSGNLQLRGEWMGRTRVNEDILLYAYPNYDPEATGYRKVFVSPQLNYHPGKVSFYLLSDIPVYQYVVKTQIVSGFQLMAGATWRFPIPVRPMADALAGYHCPMHPEIKSAHPSTCSKCGMDLVK